MRKYPYLPGLVGMDRMNDQDPYGKYQVRQLIANAENGGGFTYYFFADPGSDYAIRLKLGYSELADDDLIVGAGIFP
ncbi:MAG: cache domain-containing protein [Methanobacteriota archaeon]